MAITFVSEADPGSGISTTNVANTSSLTATMPASLASGNGLVAIWAAKDNAGTAVDNTTTPSGWTAGDTQQNGTTLSTAGAGSIRASNFTKVAAGGDTAAFSMTDADPQWVKLWQFSNTGTGWSFVDSVLTDSTVTGTTVSATGNRIAVTSGDELCVLVCTKATTLTHSSQSFTIPGCTLGSITWTTINNTRGSDFLVYWTHVSCTAGTDSGAPSYTATAATSGSSDCTVGVVRLRQTGTAATLLPPSLNLDNAAITRANYW